MDNTVLKSPESYLSTTGLGGGLPSHRRPKPTITDAMYFVSRIGERYLWVDSLCIIQDDSSTKMLQINAMDRIYTSALATIVAAYGTSCQAGLHGVRPNSGRWKQHVINIRGIELANRQTLLPGYGPRVWATRGWTYQEHALSKRLIHFAPDGIVFESEDGITNEDVHPPLHNQETAHSFPEGRGLPMGAAVVKALSSLPLLQHFAMAVSFYSMRTLTYQKDGLNAFEGILNVMRLSFRRDFLYGLPSSELDIALLWRPLSGLQRRVHDDTQEALFPTWSWVAWRGRVAFPVYESAHFSRITFVDAEDGTIEFTTRDWRGADTYPDNSSWQRKSLDIDSPPGYFEAGNPHVIYPHPVSKNLPSTVASRKFLKPSSHVLTISAFTASISARPGQGILKMWKKELDIEPDPGVNSRTLEDRFGRFCGTVYIHGDNNNNNNNAPSEESSSPRLYEVVAICRTAYGDANEAWEDPPEDDADVLTLREGYAQRQERRQRSDEWGAAGYWNHYEFELKWKAYDVLVIEWRDDGLAFRVGVGVCFVEAFWDAAPKRKRILLV
ncbi:HET-domain-containing protein [Lepidopterella palustris CBS 459.81]|uniref:HET-domain-containing protein n=1 Tax=Lepidopterella palustris CBS 459.81 TaxID=1314670 RepID=A0A8E2EE56_9PEZI|nr:HET-domain-containing protein [Lepidopterella palustris CBS 459.81]